LSYDPVFPAPASRRDLPTASRGAPCAGRTSGSTSRATRGQACCACSCSTGSCASCSPGMPGSRRCAGRSCPRGSLRSLAGPGRYHSDLAAPVACPHGFRME